MLDPGLIKGPWTKEEDELMLRLVQQHGPRNWQFIAQHLHGRIGKQCRERWHNNLNPNLKKGPWTEQEQAILEDAHRTWGNKWAAIAKLLPGRTDNHVKNYWNSVVLKRHQQSPTSSRLSSPSCSPAHSPMPSPLRQASLAGQVEHIPLSEEDEFEDEYDEEEELYDSCGGDVGDWDEERRLRISSMPGSPLVPSLPGSPLVGRSGSFGSALPRRQFSRPRGNTNPDMQALKAEPRRAASCSAAMNGAYALMREQRAGLHEAADTITFGRLDLDTILAEETMMCQQQRQQQQGQHQPFIAPFGSALPSEFVFDSGFFHNGSDLFEQVLVDVKLTAASDLSDLYSGVDPSPPAMHGNERLHSSFLNNLDDLLLAESDPGKPHDLLPDQHQPHQGQPQFSNQQQYFFTHQDQQEARMQMTMLGLQQPAMNPYYSEPLHVNGRVPLSATVQRISRV